MELVPCHVISYPDPQIQACKEDVLRVGAGEEAPWIHPNISHVVDSADSADEDCKLAYQDNKSEHKVKFFQDPKLLDTDGSNSISTPAHCFQWIIYDYCM